MKRNSTCEPWKVSLHGGHCGEFCDHGRGTLREVLEAAVRFGFHTYGVSEHAPRLGAEFLYREEVAMGWDVAKIEHDFEAYAAVIGGLAEEFEKRLAVLRGFEAEVVPTESYAAIMLGYRARFPFEYLVGSVHWVNGIQIDGPRDKFAQAVERHDGLERLGVHYYEAVAEMVESLRPEVVGHLDLVRRNAGTFGPVDTPAIRKAAEHTLEVIGAHGCILDVNTAGYRKGLGTPYPAPWLVELANRMGLGFCFGDDSHGPEDVGAGIDEARDYLLKNSVRTITYLTRRDGIVACESADLA
ncbi:MAG: histidinol-phosphatase [Candidatus Hydrogenedentes bacterium]|nr:histidinol-phosphatase [Candidatus Hydrogenedentota bacterium]